MARDQDASKARGIEAWLDLVESSYNVLPMDGAAFRAWARLMHRWSDTLEGLKVPSRPCKIRFLPRTSQSGYAMRHDVASEMATQPSYRGENGGEIAGMARSVAGRGVTKRLLCDESVAVF